MSGVYHRGGLPCNTTDKSKQQNKRKPSDPNYIHKIDQGNSMFMGNPDAKVTVTEFFDFQ